MRSGGRPENAESSRGEALSPSANRHPHGRARGEEGAGLRALLHDSARLAAAALALDPAGGASRGDQGLLRASDLHPGDVWDAAGGGGRGAAAGVPPCRWDGARRAMSHLTRASGENAELDVAAGERRSRADARIRVGGGCPRALAGRDAVVKYGEVTQRRPRRDRRASRRNTIPSGLSLVASGATIRIGLASGSNPLGARRRDRPR